MNLNKNSRENLFLILFKTLFLIVGFNIFFTSFLIFINLELKKNNMELEMNLNIQKVKYDQSFQFNFDIY